MLLVGLIIAGVGLATAIVFGSWNIYLSRKELWEQNHIALGITEVGQDIDKLAKATLASIEKDGATTRQAILDVHKSIKAELGK